MRRALGTTGTLRIIAGLAAVSLVLTACGSDNSSTPSSTAAPAASSSAPAASSSAPETSAAESSSSAAESSSAPSESSSASSGEASTVAGPTITDGSKAKVGLAYDLGGRGDQSFNDSAARGLDKAKTEGVTIVGELEATANEPDSAKVDRLEQLASKGANVIIAVGFAYAGPLGDVAPKHKDIAFGIIDDAGLCDATRDGGAVPNVACLTFAEEQGSYLVGVAAALKTKTDHVGFIGGVNVPLIQKFQAGYDAGVKATKPDVKIDNKYITEPPDFTGFNAPDKGQTIARGMYDGGADIIFAAAGGSGAGVFKAAKSAKGFGIGVDSDQYNLPSLADVKDVIITSMVKNVDVAVYDMIASVANGKALTGQKVYDLKVGGVGYATSGGAIDDITPQLEDVKAKIISGEITVPTTVS